MGREYVETEKILESLKWRYAVKKYDPTKKVSDEDWKTLEEALLLAPSSMGMQPYKFIVVKDPETREQLKAASYGQTQITDASHLVVFAYKETLTDDDADRLLDVSQRLEERRANHWRISSLLSDRLPSVQSKADTPTPGIHARRILHSGFSLKLRR